MAGWGEGMKVFGKQKEKLLADSSQISKQIYGDLKGLKKKHVDKACL